MFMDIVKLLELNVDLHSAQILPPVEGKFFRRSDFTEGVLAQALKNIEEGLISSFVADPETFVRNFPIVQHRQLGINS
jgi:hypothetical protein